LRPLVDVIRGKDVISSLNFLSTYRVMRVVPIKKLLESAVANAKNLKDVEKEDLVIKEIKVDKGPQYKYFKPSARGISSVFRKRFSHISLILENKDSKKV